jgi:hypothetical protein
MTPAEALQEINDAGKTGSFYITPHANQEAKECSASRYDIQEALRTAYQANHQPTNDRWRVLGKDLDGDDLTVIVVFDAGVVVVTVF